MDKDEIELNKNLDKLKKNEGWEKKLIEDTLYLQGFMITTISFLYLLPESITKWDPSEANGNDYTGLTGPGALALDATAAAVGGATAVSAVDLTTYADLKTGGGEPTTLYNGGLLVFNGSTFTITDEGINYGTISIGGTVVVGQ